MPRLTEQLRARIGETRSYTAPEPISAAAIRYYASAVGDDDPRYPEVAPPTLLCDSNQYAALPRDEDGFAGHSWGIEIPGTRMVRGGNDYAFHRPARPDDVVTVTWRLADIAERVRGDGSAMLVVTSEQQVAGAAGDAILTNTETIIYLDLAGGAA